MSDERAPRKAHTKRAEAIDHKAPHEGLAALLEEHRGEHHLIVIQDYPDPDAISSAFAHQRIAAHYDIECDILYGGRVSHQQNRAMVRLLNIEMRRFAPDLDLTPYQGAVYVDNQGTTSDEVTAAVERAGIPVLAIIDHHEPQDRLKAPFKDIRRVGATATIYTEYILKGLLDLERSRQEDVVLATALMHGILTDTGQFIHAGPEDFQAAAFLSRYRDAELLAQIMSQARPRHTMEVIQRALANRLVVESYSIAGVGYLRAEDRDAIPQAAEFLITEENVHTAIVYGIVVKDDEQETLVGSMRTTKITLDPDEFLKEVFGRTEEGEYFGGGKLAAGGFEIPIGFLAGESDEEYRELKWQLYKKQIERRIFTRLGIELPKERETEAGKAE